MWTFPAGDDSVFELGVSEIKAANRLARKKGGRWRILRVRNALSSRAGVRLAAQPVRGWLQGALSTPPGRNAGVVFPPVDALRSSSPLLPDEAGEVLECWMLAADIC